MKICKRCGLPIPKERVDHFAELGQVVTRCTNCSTEKPRLALMEEIDGVLQTVISPKNKEQQRLVRDAINRTLKTSIEEEDDDNVDSDV